MNAAAPIVRAVDVGKVYGGHRALAGITLDVQPAEVLCIIGPSGSGKTTFLRCINQLERIDTGALWVDGALAGYHRVGDVLHPLGERDIARQRRAIGMVFQRFNLFPHLTALQNVTEGPLRVLKREPAKVAVEARRLLDRVGLAAKAGAFPAELSGGQQQRVAIARALAMHPRLLLFDEPTSALDPELVGEVLAVMQDLARSGMTMIVVTHELAFAREVADRIVFMADGKVVEAGTPTEVLDQPQHTRTRAFLSAVLHGGSHASDTETSRGLANSPPVSAT